MIKALGPKKVPVKAKYPGLKNKKVAIVTIAADNIKHDVPMTVTKEIQRSLIEAKMDIPGMKLIRDSQIKEFQEKNPHWQLPVVTPKDWLKGLGADRLVLVDLTRFRTHEPGNPHLLKGQCVATVKVYEVDKSDPNQTVFLNKDIEVNYPEGREVGIPDGDEDKVLDRLHKGLAIKVSRLFYDHIELVPR